RGAIWWSQRSMREYMVGCHTCRGRYAGGRSAPLERVPNAMKGKTCMRQLLLTMGSLFALVTASSAKQAPASEKHKKLDTLVGSWDVTVTFKLGSKENKGTATCQAKWILDGRFVQQ